MSSGLSPECVRFVFELCDHRVEEAEPEALLAASEAVPQERVDAVAGEVRRLLDEQLLEADRSGRLRPTLDGLWVVLNRARELTLAVPPGLLLGLGVLAIPAAQRTRATRPVSSPS